MKIYIKLLLCIGVQMNMYAMQQKVMRPIDRLICNAIKDQDHEAIRTLCKSGEMPDTLYFRDDRALAIPPISLSPLTYALEKDAWEIVRILLSECPQMNINILTEGIFVYEPFYAGSPLMAAIEKGEAGKEFFDMLLQDQRVDVNLCNEEITPLLQAIVCKGEYAIKQLLEHPDIKVNMRDDEGGTPLMEAVRQNNDYAVEQLLRYPGIEVDARVQEEGVFITAESLAYEIADNLSVQERQQTEEASRDLADRISYFDEKRSNEKIRKLFEDCRRCQERIKAALVMQRGRAFLSLVLSRGPVKQAIIEYL